MLDTPPRRMLVFLLTVPVTYFVSRLAERWDIVDGPHTDNWFTRFTAKLAGFYCELFHLDEIIEGRKVDTPSQFIATYTQAIWQLAKLSQTKQEYSA